MSKQETGLPSDMTWASSLSAMARKHLALVALARKKPEAFWSIPRAQRRQVFGDLSKRGREAVLRAARSHE